MLIDAAEPDPYAGPAFAISVWALVISALGFLVAAITAIRGFIEDRKAGAQVRVERQALRGAAVQYIDVTVRNTGRTAITVNAVMLYGTTTTRGRKPKPDGSGGLYMESAPGEKMEDLKPYRLEGHASLELQVAARRGAPLFGLERYWVDVELATGRTIRSGWFANATTS